MQLLTASCEQDSGHIALCAECDRQLVVRGELGEPPPLLLLLPLVPSAEISDPIEQNAGTTSCQVRSDLQPAETSTVNTQWQAE